MSYEGNIYITRTLNGHICRIVTGEDVKYILSSKEINSYNSSVFYVRDNFTLVGNIKDENLKGLTSNEILLNFEALFVEYLI